MEIDIRGNDGGNQEPMIPYGRQWVDEEDIQAVADVLRSDWLTTGPTIEQFEKVFADFVGAKYAVAVNSGTAALHASMFALGISPGDEVIVPAMTFVLGDRHDETDAGSIRRVLGSTSAKTGVPP